MPTKGGGVKIIDMTEGLVEVKKSTKASSVWFLTSVYHRVVRRMTPDGWEYIPDYEDFKKYLNERVADFYDNYFEGCIGSKYHPEMMQYLPEISLRFEDLALEVNSLGLLHHHVIVEATYPRIVNEADPQKRLKRFEIDYVALNKVFREVMQLGGISTKIKNENIQTNSYENLKNYILKKAE